MNWLLPRLVTSKTAQTQDCVPIVRHLWRNENYLGHLGLKFWYLSLTWQEPKTNFTNLYILKSEAYIGHTKPTHLHWMQHVLSAMPKHSFFPTNFIWIGQGVGILWLQHYDLFYWLCNFFILNRWVYNRSPFIVMYMMSVYLTFTPEITYYSICPNISGQL